MKDFTSKIQTLIERENNLLQEIIPVLAILEIANIEDCEIELDSANACSCSTACGSNYSWNGKCSCTTSCGSNYNRS